MPLRRQRPRTGLTLVEVMIALVLVAIGLLGMAGSSALLLRAATVHAQSRRAMRQASLRLVSLAAGGCVRARGGVSTDTRSGLVERWSIGAADQSAVTVDDTVTWTSRGATQHLVVRGAVLC